MKNINTFFLTLLSVFFFNLADAQNYSANLDFYVGTWVYSDPSIGEEFTVKLRKTFRYDSDGIIKVLLTIIL